MIYILKDGDKEIGFHYDIGELLKACETLKPKHEFHIEFSYEDFEDIKIKEVKKCSKKKRVIKYGKR